MGSQPKLTPQRVEHLGRCGARHPVAMLSNDFLPRTKAAMPIPHQVTGNLDTVDEPHRPPDEMTKLSLRGFLAFHVIHMKDPIVPAESFANIRQRQFLGGEVGDVPVV